tara:strand:+ start:307 stop:447 length:141 start_codon:yes stop_codon:yes gene_type:complete
MPIHIRRYHIRMIDGLHKKQNEEIKRARQGKESASEMPKMPNINKK